MPALEELKPKVTPVLPGPEEVKVAVQLPAMLSAGTPSEIVPVPNKVNEVCEAKRVDNELSVSE